MKEIENRAAAVFIFQFSKAYKTRRKQWLQATLMNRHTGLSHLTTIFFFFNLILFLLSFPLLEFFSPLILMHNIFFSLKLLRLKLIISNPTHLNPYIYSVPQLPHGGIVENLDRENHISTCSSSDSPSWFLSVLRRILPFFFFMLIPFLAHLS